MNEKAKAIRALELFNEKAEELFSSTFVKKMFEEPSGVNLSISYETGEEVTNFERKGPNKEEIKSFVLDYRFFIQNNERSSFKNMKDVYSSPLLSTKFEARFDSARDVLNKYLDSASKSIPITFNNELSKRRKIIDTFIYGGFAHANEEKELLFKEWRNIPMFFPIIENEFVYSLIKILEVISFIRNLNLEALEELKTI
jgi:hypothetical protein